MADGALCLVLHGHLPWVLNHGRWPHGEDWLFEAAAETWLPLVDVLDTLEAEGIRPGWSLGLTPILLEQLASPRFAGGFRNWLDERVAMAERDASGGEMDPAAAERWAVHFRSLRARFDALDGDLVAALRGRPGVELLTSNATHGFHPMVLNDRCARALVRAGVATSTRHLLAQPHAAWLPECAYRPDGHHRPAVLHGNERWQAGTATLFEESGVRSFVVDTHLIRGCAPVGRVQGDELVPLEPGETSDAGRAWRTELEPHRVVEAGRLTGLTVLGRCPGVSEQVWSGEVGYPGDARYLEFHKRHGAQGLRYWAVTGRDVDLGDKVPYAPDVVPSVVRSHALHFVGAVQRRLAAHRQGTGRFGVVCAPFDAELFGHWWHEGPQFLLAVARCLAANESVQPMTMSEYLARVPADKAATLPSGTWGAGGDERVWVNDELRFHWEIVFRAEDRFLELLDRSDDVGNELLEAAGRQLLLLAASDWPFVIHTRGAVDYGLRRILDHAARFDDLCNGVEDVLAGRPEDPVVRSALERSRLLEPVFPELTLDWWR